MNITIEGVSKIYKGRTTALDDVSLELTPGLFGLIGRNGAGKTTLMRILATVLEPTVGTIRFDGKDIRQHKLEYRSSLGYLPQNTRLIPHMNIGEFLDYMCVLKGIRDGAARKREIERCTQLVGLEKEGKKALSKYSGGMLRRAGIAQALLGDQAFIIVDEPTAGLDPEEQLYFLNILSGLGAHATILFSTHIIKDVENICENVCIIDMGKIRYLGTTSDLLEQLQNRIWECTVSPGEETAIRQKTIVTSITNVKGSPVVRYCAEESLYPGSEIAEPLLEDAFMYQLGGIKR